jgi:hypothetical protein
MPRFDTADVHGGGHLDSLSQPSSDVKGAPNPQVHTGIPFFSSLRCGRDGLLLLGGRTVEVRAGAVEDPLAELVVVAQGGGTDLEDPLGPLRAIPELLGSLDAVVDFFDYTLRGQE